jgi:hypothetical protein
MTSRLCLFLTLGLAASAAWSADLDLPSGQEVSLIEQITDEDGVAGLTWRFRFLAPEIARASGRVGAEDALKDMDVLCQTVALPAAKAAPMPPAQVIISVMDQMVPFGEAAPEATQYFEAYAIKDGACVWESF